MVQVKQKEHLLYDVTRIVNEKYQKRGMAVPAAVQAAIDTLDQVSQGLFAQVNVRSQLGQSFTAQELGQMDQTVRGALEAFLANHAVAGERSATHGPGQHRQDRSLTVEGQSPNGHRRQRQESSFNDPISHALLSLLSSRRMPASRSALVIARSPSAMAANET